MMYIKYVYNSETELHQHIVELYDEGYDAFFGLIGETCNRMCSPNYIEIINKIKSEITEESKVQLISLCKLKLNGIISPSGEYIKD